MSSIINDVLFGLSQNGQVTDESSSNRENVSKIMNLVMGLLEILLQDQSLTEKEMGELGNIIKTYGLPISPEDLIRSMTMGKSTTPDSVDAQKIFGDPDPKNILSSGELHPKLTPLIQDLVQKAREQGLNVFVFEGHRSFQRQDALYKSGLNVTQAKAGQSYHNFGLAADIVFYDANGKPSWSDEHDWNKLGQIGRGLGLKWGGDFKTIKDLSHFEYHPTVDIKNDG